MYADFDVASLTTTGPSILVSNEEEFYSAVDTLSSGAGGKILLSSDMERLQIQLNGFGPSSGELIITSEDPDNPTEIAGVRLIDSSNITVAGLSFNSVDFDRAEWLVDLMVTGGENISFIGNHMQGAATDMLTSADAQMEDGGLIRQSANFTFTDNYVAGYTYGISVLDVAEANISSNEFTKLQGDALNGGGWQNFLIEDNYFHDMYGSTQEVSHSDMIQIWGTGVDLRTDGVTIRANVMDSGDGPAYQSIFVRHDPGSSTSDWHTNILVEDNIIYNAMPNGIRLTDSVDVTVLNNTVLWNQDAESYTTESISTSYAPHINISAVGTVTVEGNIAPYIYAPEGTDLSDNVLLNYSSVTDPNYFTNHFVNIAPGSTGTLLDLQLLPDSPFVGYGASGTQPTYDAEDLTAVMRYESVDGDRASLVLDASYTRDEFGYLDDDRGTFTWTFEDGSTKLGEVVTHDFGTASGFQSVKLTVTDSTGDVSEIEQEVWVMGTRIAEIDFEGAIEDWSDIQADSISAEMLTSGTDGSALYLDGSTAVEFERGSAYHDLESFTISFQLQKESAEGTGRVFDMANSMSFDVTSDEYLQFSMTTDIDDFVLKSDTEISDTAWHNIEIVYDGDNNALSLHLDGDEVGLMAADGATASASYWGLVLGTHPWRSGLAANVDNFSFTSEPATIYDGPTLTVTNGAPLEDTEDTTDALDDLIDDILGEDDAVAQEDPVVEDVADPAPVEDTPVVEDVAEDIAEDIGDEVEDDTGFLQDLVSDILQGDTTDQAEEPAAPVEEDEPVDAEVEEPVVVEGTENTGPEDTVTEDEDIVTQDTGSQDVAPDVSEEVEDDPIVIEEPAVVEEPAPQATTEDEDSGNFLANIFQSLFGIFGALFGGGEKSDAAEAATDKGAASQAELSQTDSQLISLPDADDLLDSLTLENSELSETSIYTDLDQAYIGYEQQAQDAHYAGL